MPRKHWEDSSPCLCKETVVLQELQTSNFLLPNLFRTLFMSINRCNQRQFRSLVNWQMHLAKYICWIPTVVSWLHPVLWWLYAQRKVICPLEAALLFTKCVPNPRSAPQAEALGQTKSLPSWRDSMCCFCSVLGWQFANNHLPHCYSLIGPRNARPRSHLIQAFKRCSLDGSCKNWGARCKTQSTSCV